MLLILACGLLCFASANAMAGELERRVALLYALHRDIAAMRGWMAGSLPPMRLMLLRLREGSLQALWDGVNAELTRAESFDQAWKNCLGTLRRDALQPLSEEEYRLVLELGDAFCATQDTKAQLRFIDGLLQRLQLFAEEARAQTQKRARLYRSLGVLGGLALAVVIC
ncbi:MAG: stage III sporulation protein AB [Clostridia bacterium]|nr:stage III sporulation protein AB [Clostridia bacterium]